MSTRSKAIQGRNRTREGLESPGFSRGEDVNKTISWSHSAMTQFRTCPAQYAAERVYKTAQRSENDASIWGNRVHEALEFRLREGRPLTEEFGSYEETAALLEGIPGTMFVEHEMALTRDKQPCPWESDRMWVRGIADVLIVNKDKALVWDHKTGKPKDDSLQLKLFALFVFAHFPQVEVVTTIYAWLKFGTRTTEIYRRGQIEFMWPIFEGQYADLVECFEMDDFPPRPSGLCRRWCNHKLCHYYKEK